MDRGLTLNPTPYTLNPKPYRVASYFWSAEWSRRPQLTKSKLHGVKGLGSILGII